MADRPRLEIRWLPNTNVEHAPLTGHTIYLNRCIGGCPIAPGDDDGTGSTTMSVIANNAFTMAEASDLTQQEWDDTVQCVKEVYSPFAVTVTDVKPVAGVSHSTCIVGGNDANKGAIALLGPAGNGVGGIAPGGCSPFPRGVSYAFADNDNLNIFAQEILRDTTPRARSLGLCWIIAQETAHSFGLDHQFDYIDDKASACNDPMTYEADCGGQKFFRNRFASCGVSGGIDGSEPGPRACRCGISQNSHLKLLSVFGEGASLIGPPTAAITAPPASSTGANSLPATVIVEAGSKRGVGRVELFLNGHKWAETKGAAFGFSGQPNPGQYGLQVPANAPNSIYDVVVRAYDDLEIVGESPVVTVTKGPVGGCTSADTCAVGQNCEAGKCFWDPPAGELGDPCTFPEFCLSGLCQGTADLQVCTQNCVVGLADACPDGLACLATGNTGICFPVEESGCCSTTNQKTPWAPFVFAGALLGMIILRRRRR